MQETYVENIGKVFNNKKRLEAELKTKITNKGKNVFISGKPEDEFIALKVMEAINLGFSIERALLLKNPEILIQTLNIKDVTKKHNLEEIRARIIGTKGKTLRALNTLTDCFISLKDNQIGIIGNCENIKEAIQAGTSLIRGSKQGHVYGRLERQKKKKRLMEKGIEDI
ncbi:MAG: KH domain-containing protein [Nanoarchaeota archaeon]|nr:KH domain-containing protein [Nanoarchaeota archaeon]